MKGNRSWSDRMTVVIGSLGPLGHLPASGTVSVAVVGVPLYWWMQDWSPWAVLAMALGWTLAAWFLHERGDRILQQKDSRRLVWDEVAGFLVAIQFVPFSWPLALAAFLLERFFDITKIPPARWIEQRIPGGLGVVGDDVIAGLYACAALHIITASAPTWAGVSG